MPYTHTVGVVVPSSTVDIAILSPSISAARLLLSMLLLASVPTGIRGIFVSSMQTINCCMSNNKNCTAAETYQGPTG